MAVTDPVRARRANGALEPLVDYINGGAFQLPANLTSTYLRKSKRGREREHRYYQCFIKAAPLVGAGAPRVRREAVSRRRLLLKKRQRRTTFRDHGGGGGVSRPRVSAQAPMLALRGGRKTMTMSDAQL